MRYAASLAMLWLAAGCFLVAVVGSLAWLIYMVRGGR